MQAGAAATLHQDLLDLNSASNSMPVAVVAMHAGAAATQDQDWLALNSMVSNSIKVQSEE